MKKPTLRASELDRVLSCNGSLALVPLVAPRESDDGDEGTMIHWLIATRLIKDYGATPPEGGLPPPDVPAGYKLPSASLWIVDWCVRHAVEMVPATWSLMVEVPLAYSYDRWDDSGHEDLFAIDPTCTEAIGIDWKSVRNPVDPADSNWQVFDYQVLAKRAWPSLAKITFQICQPRVTEDDEVERVSTCVLGGERLERASDTLNAAVCAALDNQMELNSSRKACAYCPVGVQCFALQDELKLMKHTMTVAEVARISKEPNDALLGDWIIASRTLTKPTEMAVALLHKRLDAAPVVVAGNGTHISREIQNGSYTMDKPLEFYRETKKMLVSDERVSRVYNKPSVTRLRDELADAFNVPKTGQSAVTAQSMVEGHFKPFMTQGTKRLLKFQEA